jgi:hypothetical protein
MTWKGLFVVGEFATQSGKLQPAAVMQRSISRPVVSEERKIPADTIRERKPEKDRKK